MTAPVPMNWGFFSPDFDSGMISDVTLCPAAGTYGVTTAFRLHRNGGYVSFYLALTSGVAVTGVASGDVTNTVVAAVSPSLAALLPANTASLVAGSSTLQYGYVLTTAGNVYLVQAPYNQGVTAGTSGVAGTALTIHGTYAIQN